jgi:NCS1 family nucleobase:cation symporter-1
MPFFGLYRKKGELAQGLLSSLPVRHFPLSFRCSWLAFAFLIAQFGINIAGNAISGGIDLASMFPKYINLKRGAYIVSSKNWKKCQKGSHLYQTTAMALPMCPWALLSGATVFISVMGGYATFLAPICGLMVSDYLLVRRGNVKLSSLVSRLQ